LKQISLKKEKTVTKKFWLHLKRNIG
jgi:hypothetical protein